MNSLLLAIVGLPPEKVWRHPALPSMAILLRLGLKFPEFAWGNLLTARLGCRVDNYGVIGYGTDQAYLYFKYHHEHGLDRAPVVILSHLSENIVRNITQDLGFIYQMPLALKPRFVLEPSGALRLVPMPRLTPADYDAYRRDMRQFLHAEYLLPSQSVLSKRRIFFPYMITVPYLFTYKRIYASLLFYAFDVPRGLPHYTTRHILLTPCR